MVTGQSRVGHKVSYGSVTLTLTSVIFQVTPKLGNCLLFHTTMSDLDADLYGGEFNSFTTGSTNSLGLDLYSNDGVEEQPQEEKRHPTTM